MSERWARPFPRTGSRLIGSLNDSAKARAPQQTRTRAANPHLCVQEHRHWTFRELVHCETEQRFDEAAPTSSVLPASPTHLPLLMTRITDSERSALGECAVGSRLNSLHRINNDVRLLDIHVVAALVGDK
jgi:hypothetical protein